MSMSNKTIINSHLWNCPKCGKTNFGIGCSGEHCDYSKSIGYNIWKERSKKMFGR